MSTSIADIPWDVGWEVTNSMNAEKMDLLQKKIPTLCIALIYISAAGTELLLRLTTVAEERAVGDVESSTQ